MSKDTIAQEYEWIRTGHWKLSDYRRHIEMLEAAARDQTSFSKTLAKLTDAERLAEAEHALGRTEGSIYG